MTKEIETTEAFRIDGQPPVNPPPSHSLDLPSSFSGQFRFPPSNAVINSPPTTGADLPFEPAFSPPPRYSPPQYYPAAGYSVVPPTPPPLGFRPDLPNMAGVGETAGLFAYMGANQSGIERMRCTAYEALKDRLPRPEINTVYSLDDILPGFELEIGIAPDGGPLGFFVHTKGNSSESGLFIGPNDGSLWHGTLPIRAEWGQTPPSYISGENTNAMAMLNAIRRAGPFTIYPSGQERPVNAMTALMHGAFQMLPKASVQLQEGTTKFTKSNMEFNLSDREKQELSALFTKLEKDWPHFWSGIRADLIAPSRPAAAYKSDRDYWTGTQKIGPISKQLVNATVEQKDEMAVPKMRAKP